jgi:purine-nucleoside phosphorylase
MEVIAARHMGIRTVGLSCITNLASGILNQPLNHKEVTDAAKAAEINFIRALTDFISTL